MALVDEWRLDQSSTPAANTIDVQLEDEELAARRAAWRRPPLPVRQGVLLKYIRSVSDASHGCITDLLEEDYVPEPALSSARR
ncbi:MAG: hypothetical protein WKG07_18865 [Hymenobacter sp.]